MRKDQKESEKQSKESLQYHQEQIVSRLADQERMLEKAIEKIEKFQDAVQIAAKSAIESSVVLLSPACSSFDQFDNYEQRGIKFKKIIERFYA